jgi:hypothetical protein
MSDDLNLVEQLQKETGIKLRRVPLDVSGQANIYIYGSWRDK